MQFFNYILKEELIHIDFKLNKNILKVEASIIIIILLQYQSSQKSGLIQDRPSI